MVPAPAGHIALWRTSRRRRLLLLGFLPAAPQNSKVDPRRRRGLEPLRARGAAGELRGAHHRPAESGHTDPRAPVAAAPAPLGVRLPSPPEFRAAADWSRRSAWRRLRARRPFAWGSARACRRVRDHLPARVHRGRRGQQRRLGLSGRGEQTKLYLRKASGVYRKLPVAGRRNNPRFKGLRGLGPRAAHGLPGLH